MAQAKKKTAAKRKTARKKATKRAPAAEVIRAEPNGSLLDPDAIQAAAETLMQAVEVYRDELTELPENGELRQNHIAVARFAAFAKGAMGDMTEVFEANALRLRQTGSIEEGPLRVDYDLQKGKQSPKWKDEAAKQAAEVAKLKELDFDKAEYEKVVKAGTKKSADKYKPIIRETS
jgi:hypothetical protein